MTSPTPPPVRGALQLAAKRALVLPGIELMSSSPALQQYPGQTIHTCPRCGAEFCAYAYKGRQFCSRSCAKKTSWEVRGERRKLATTDQQCRRCKEFFPVSEFPPAGSGNPGFICRRCHQDDPVRRRRYRLSENYDISLEAWSALYVSQAGRCAICACQLPALSEMQQSLPRKDKGFRWSTDHCHLTGKVRGILCHGCNVGIGYFREDVEVVRRAIKYLDSHRLAGDAQPQAHSGNAIFTQATNRRESSTVDA